MPEIITVSCSPGANPPVTCSPDNLDVPPGIQEIQFVSGTSGATISGIVWGPSGDPFEIDPTPANNWTGTDNNQDTSPVTYTYTISMEMNGQVYSSDPEITNEPGGWTITHHPSQE